MDQPRKVAKPTRGQLGRGMVAVLADASIRGKYICTAICICFTDKFLFGYTYINARFTAVYPYMCDYSGTCTYNYMMYIMYTVYHDISITVFMLRQFDQ